MEDKDVLRRIEALVAEEHDLLNKRSEGTIGAEGHQRLEELQVNLDQCWDYLRQRRAARESGLEPDSASVRSGATVERYQQ